MTNLISIILLAGGQGSRMRSSIPKQFLCLRDKPISFYSLELFLSLKDPFEIIIVCEEPYRSLFTPLGTFKFALPGKRRQDSVFNGLSLASPHSTLICIHDSARPLLNAEDLHKVIEVGKVHGAAALAIPVKATIKEADDALHVVRTLDRAKLWEIQTPQVAHPALLREGFARAQKDDVTVTDDVSLVELTGKPVTLVPGSYRNIKITTPEDLTLAEVFLPYV